MKKRRPAWTHLILFILVPAILGIIPLLVVDLEELFAVNGSLAYVYFGFVIFIGGISLIEMIRLFIGERRENNLLDRRDGATRTKATFLASHYKTSTQVNGRTTSVLHNVRFSYNDEKGRFVSRQSFKLYNPLEIQYLQDLVEFDILMKGNVAVIIEDLDPQVIADYYARKEREFKQNFNQ